MFFMGRFSNALVPSHLEEVDFTLLENLVRLEAVHNIVVNQASIHAHCHIHHLPRSLADSDSVLGMESGYQD